MTVASEQVVKGKPSGGKASGTASAGAAPGGEHIDGSQQPPAQRNTANVPPPPVPQPASLRPSSTSRAITAAPSGGAGAGASNRNTNALALTKVAPQMSAAEMEQLRIELDDIERGLGGCVCCGVKNAASEAACSKEQSERQLQTARKLRHLLSTHREVLIHEVLERNWVPRLLDWLNLTDLPAVQVEALWALTNIAAGTTEHTHVLLRHNPVPALVRLLDSSNQEVLEQALWVIGNIAGEGAPARDSVLNANALRPLVQCIQRHSDSQQILRIGSWAINNLCDGQPRPVFDIGVVMPVLKSLVASEDSEVLSHTCWALSHLCDGPSAHIKVVVEANICWRLVELLKHRSWRVTKPALRTIGNIVCAEDEVDYTQHIIEAGAVPCLRELIAHSNREIQKEACWTLSNIAAGTCEQIQTVLDSGAIPLLVHLAMQPSTDAEVRSEACWVVLNATSCGSDSQIEYLVREGCIRVLGDLLNEANMVMMALEGLERILQVGEEEARRMMGANPYAGMLSSAKIEELEAHRSAAIAKRASRIWKQHFVTCAICQHNYSKHCVEVGFCDECKCYVCGACNCSVFHLSYQEELWKEMSVKEASAKEAQQAMKRNKKARKKQKEKEKKAQAKQDKAPTSSAHGGASQRAGNGASRNGSSGEESDEGERDDWDAVAPGKGAPSSSSSSSSLAGAKGPTRGPRGANAESMSSQRPHPQTAMKNGPRGPMGMPPSSSSSSLRTVLDVAGGRNGPSSGPPSPPSTRASAVTMKRSRNRAGEGQAQPPQPQQHQQQEQQQQQPQQAGREQRQEPPQAQAHGPTMASNGPAKQTAPPAGGGEDRRKGPSTGGPSDRNGGAALPEGSAAPTGKRGRNGNAGSSSSSSNPSSSNQSQSHPPQKGGKAALAADCESGIDLVDFLQSTGSIIALSKYLDEEEPGEEVGGRDSLA